jgi:LPXTG-motif cell wall-anchored protein
VTGTGVCGELTTLALTGVESGYLAVIAGLLIAAGASIVVIRRVRPGA